MPKNTKIWKIDTQTVNAMNPEIIEIGQQLKDGKIIAFPTETVYGLGANALNSEAIKGIYEAKGRPGDNPLIIHIAEKNQLYSLTDKVDYKAELLIDKFWPGPLTIIFNSKGKIPKNVTAGLTTVAVRMPNHPIALAVIKASGIPVAAPSANRSGRPSPTSAEHVLEDLYGLIDGVVDGGLTGIGVESTVIDVSAQQAVILRPGGISLEELKQVLGEVKLDPSIINKQISPRSPGMKYTHYAPRGEMWLVTGDEKIVTDKINSLAKDKIQQGKKVGILTLEEHKNLFKNGMVLAHGTKNNLYPLASHLYQALRVFDLHKIDYIFAEGVEDKGIGLAIMNRLFKAAGGKVINLTNDS